jgi:transcriptional regulator with XRE-family HTH domain
MIGNERQYRITKARADEFERGLSTLKKAEPGTDPLWHKVQQGSMAAQLEDLRGELREYETLRKRGTEAIEVTSFEELLESLVKARIAAGLTQKELGERLGLKEQQIQRYEATGYSSASLDRIKQVVEALGLRLGKGVLFATGQVSLAKLIDRSDQLGLPREFLSSRILPMEMRGKNRGALTENEDKTMALRAAARIERVFQVPSLLLFSDARIGLPSSVLAEARFKVPGRADQGKVRAYAVYAHYLGLLLLESTHGLKLKPIPNDPREIYNDVLKISGQFSLESCLKYVWNLGIPVLPLRDKGGFHGACWCVGERSVIAIKQGTESEGRWIIDLFHEVRHAAESSPDSDSSWIEEFDRSGKSDDSQEEEEATDFAVDVVLGGDAEKLVQECARESKGRLQLLKAIVPKVAERHNVRTDVLANYLAYRLDEEGQNWWGAAQNLQETGSDPWTLAKDVLVANIDSSTLNPVDLSLLVQALA